MVTLRPATSANQPKAVMVKGFWKPTFIHRGKFIHVLHPDHLVSMHTDICQNPPGLVQAAFKF